MVMRVAFAVVLVAALAGCGASGNAPSGAKVAQATTSESPSAPSASEEPGRKLVPALFAVKEVSHDRAAVTLVVAGIAGCAGPGPARGSVTETGEALLVEAEVSVQEEEEGGLCPAGLPMQSVIVELPRPLRPDEQVVGECVPDEATSEGRVCSATHAFAELPPP